MVGIINQCTTRQQIQILCSEGDQLLNYDLKLDLDLIRKENESRNQLLSPSRNKTLATIVNDLYSERMEYEKLKN